MSESIFKLDFNGQAVIKEDFELIGETAGLADDRVLAELLRLTPYDGSSVARGILPYRHQTSSARAETVGGNGATGSVKVRPFRAVIGSRTTEASDAKANWRDIRSAISTGGTISITANASGNPRWDLVYAAVAVDENSAAVTRKVKDPASGVVTDQSVATSKVTTVTLGVSEGTPVASPAWPAAPSDGGGTYYIPLAYVRVPNGFNATSTVDERDIAIVAATVGVAGTCRPANSVFKQGGAYLTTARIGTWGSSGTAPSLFMPPTMTTAEELIVPLDLSGGSHVSGDIIDDSRDWRGRICRFDGVTCSAMPWSNDGSVSDIFSSFGSGMGQSCVIGSGETEMDVARISTINGAAATVNVTLYVDATTGALKVKITGAAVGGMLPIIFWLRFSPVIENYRR